MENKRKFGIANSNITPWPKIFWIKYDIDISIEALKKMIDLQNNSYYDLDEQLFKKIKATRRTNGFKSEEELEQYVSHLHGIEESIISELRKIQITNQINAIFSMFENKLKMICERLNGDYNLSLPEKKAPYITYYWKALQNFIQKNSAQLEKYFTPIYNKYVVRNVLSHQDSLAEKKQYESFKHLKNIMTIESEDKYYIYEIDKLFCSTLITELELFFKNLLQALEEKTNK